MACPRRFETAGRETPIESGWLASADTEEPVRLRRTIVEPGDC